MLILRQGGGGGGEIAVSSGCLALTSVLLTSLQTDSRKGPGCHSKAAPAARASPLPPHVRQAPWLQESLLACLQPQSLAVKHAKPGPSLSRTGCFMAEFSLAGTADPVCQSEDLPLQGAYEQRLHEMDQLIDDKHLMNERFCSTPYTIRNIYLYIYKYVHMHIYIYIRNICIYFWLFLVAKKSVISNSLNHTFSFSVLFILPLHLPWPCFNAFSLIFSLKFWFI